jgi:hypothetical protein
MKMYVAGIIVINVLRNQISFSLARVTRYIDINPTRVKIKLPVKKSINNYSFS